MTITARTQNTFNRRVISGVVGGLAGGLVFGVMMGLMGMLPMVAGLAGSSSAVVGFLVHMVISAILGAGYGVSFGPQSTTFGQGALWGLVYGVIWWVLGPLVIMPAMMGMGVQFGAAFTSPMLMSLVGHAIYGVITGLVFVWYSYRSHG